MNGSNACPHCGANTLGYCGSWSKRFTAMLGEFANPLKFFWNVWSPLVRVFFQDMKVVREELRCYSCNMYAFICPECEVASKLYTRPSQAEVITCSNCAKRSVFRLD